MTQAIVLYDSNFGNNKKLAEALGEGLMSSGISVDVRKVSDFDVKKLAGYDLICIGGPTHVTQMSQPVKDFFSLIKSIDLAGKKGFCFGTRKQSRMNLFNINGSAKKIEKKLKKNGVKMIKDAVNVLVLGREGPLEEGSVDLFKEIGVSLWQLF